MAMNSNESYSDIIQPLKYNQIISEEHLYIKESDHCIMKLIEEKIKNNVMSELVELGCGPGRLFPLVSKIKNIRNYSA